MAEAELHIVIKRAGDPEQLGALVNAAYALAMEGRTQVAVPKGYRCEQCWRDDGKHEPTCSIGAEEQ